jgi:hypothetical protein
MCDMKSQRLVAASDHVRALAKDPKTTTVLHGRSLPLTGSEALAEFTSWCRAASTRKPLLLVLDCLDVPASSWECSPPPPWGSQRDISWLPLGLPNVHVILSLRVDPPGLSVSGCAGGESSQHALKSFKRFGWPIVTVEPITSTQRRGLVDEFLNRGQGPPSSLTPPLSHTPGALSIVSHLASWAPPSALRATEASLSLSQVSPRP